LEFEHPILGGRIAFESPLPLDLRLLAGDLPIHDYVAETSSSASTGSVRAASPSALHQRS
jgi:hypothetical protein